MFVRYSVCVAYDTWLCENVFTLCVAQRNQIPDFCSSRVQINIQTVLSNLWPAGLRDTSAIFLFRTCYIQVSWLRPSRYGHYKMVDNKRDRTKNTFQPLLTARKTGYDYVKVQCGYTVSVSNLLPINYITLGIWGQLYKKEDCQGSVWYGAQKD